MAHPLAKQWKSKVRGSADANGDFDLTQMTEGGDASHCTHGPNHDPITGITDEITGQPEAPAAKFFVRIDQVPENFPGIKLQYRGVAILNPNNNQINKIIGLKRVIVTSFAPEVSRKSKEDEETLASIIRALAQDEGTWVATQP
jgi:hypothetical protein